MKSIFPLLALQLSLISFNLSSSTALQFATIIMGLNRTIEHLDHASALMLQDYGDIAVKYPQSEQVMDKLFRDVINLIGRTGVTFKPLREMMLPLSATKQRGFQVPPDLIPAMTALTLNKLVSTIRTCSNSLESQWKEAAEELLKTAGNPGPELKADIASFVVRIFATLQSAVRPLKQLMSEVPEAEEVQMMMKELEQAQSKYAQNERIILSGLKNLDVSKEQVEYIAEVLEDYRVEVEREFPRVGGVDSEKLSAEKEVYLSALEHHVPFLSLGGYKWFKLREKLFKLYDDAVTAELDSIGLQHLRPRVQWIKDYVEAQQPVVNAAKRQHQHCDQEIAQLAMKMIQEFKAADERFLAANMNIQQNAPTDLTAHKTLIAIKAAEVTSAAIIRNALASAMTTENVAEIIPSYQEVSAQLEWLAGHTEKMVQVLIKDKENIAAGVARPYKLLTDFSHQIHAVNDVVTVASSLQNTTQKLQNSLEAYPSQLNLVNGVVKGALQKLLLAVLEAIRAVREKDNVGGEIYTKLYEKVKMVVHAMVIDLLQKTFHASNNQLPGKLVSEIRGLLDQLVSAFHSPSKLESFREEL